MSTNSHYIYNQCINVVTHQCICSFPFPLVLCFFLSFWGLVFNTWHNLMHSYCILCKITEDIEQKCLFTRIKNLKCITHYINLQPYKDQEYLNFHCKKWYLPFFFCKIAECKSNKSCSHSTDYVLLYKIRKRYWKLNCTVTDTGLKVN